MQQDLLQGPEGGRGVGDFHHLALSIESLLLDLQGENMQYHHCRLRKIKLLGGSNRSLRIVEKHLTDCTKAHGTNDDNRTLPEGANRGHKRYSGTMIRSTHELNLFLTSAMQTGLRISEPKWGLTHTLLTSSAWNGISLAHPGGPPRGIVNTRVLFWPSRRYVLTANLSGQSSPSAMMTNTDRRG